MKRLVLAGAGHAHAQVLQDWARAPVPGVELVVVSPYALAPYSGMVPGWLSGTYRFDEIVIDFEALCQAAGARWLALEMLAVDPDRQELALSGGETLIYDWLSLNVGSTLTPPTGTSAEVLCMRPLSTLRVAYEDLLERWQRPIPAHAAQLPFTVTAVGAGAAGFESLLAVLARLRGLQPHRPVVGRLVSRGSALLPDIAPTARRAAWRALDAAGVSVELKTDGLQAIASPTDLVLWATGAQALAWQRRPESRGTLAVNAQGFVRINSQLQSISHPNIFAVGDCAHWDAPEKPLPKAGVYAVRMGPVLSYNLRAATEHRPVRRYRPQRKFLLLLSTANGRAIASWGPLGAEGAWAWRWKDSIDRGFLRGFGRSAG